MLSNQKCVVCNKSALLVCGKCKAVYYCTGDCQRADWKQHKHTCDKTIKLKLYIAIKNNDLSIVSDILNTYPLLINKCESGSGKGVVYDNDTKDTPLHIASECGHY